MLMIIKIFDMYIYKNKINLKKNKKFNLKKIIEKSSFVFGHAKIFLKFSYFLVFAL